MDKIGYAIAGLIAMGSVVVLILLVIMLIH
jgi:hypothetical protein